MRTLVWFRGKDLRVADHAPLLHAVECGEVIPLFVLDPNHLSPAGAADHPHRVQYVLDALSSLSANLSHRGSQLIVVAGAAAEVIPRLALRWRVDQVVAQRTVEPRGRARDERLRQRLSVPLLLLEGEMLQPPGTIRTQGGTPFSVFTAFARAWRSQASIDAPRPAPKALPSLPKDLQLDDAVPIPTLQALGVTRNEHVIEGGERASHQRLKQFIEHAASCYHEQRDRMDVAGTSRLSADLRFGTLSPRTVWTAVERALSSSAPEAMRVFHNELLWREFTHATLWDRPQLLSEPFQSAWRDFPYFLGQDNDSLWRAWTTGHTGYPIVDAAARQLLTEGFVHNRARMISASFLTKHLLIHYQRGEAHYLRYLVDGDVAQNNAGWQWSAGCGCDAQPYFRVFNPVTQGNKFDPEGDYVRRYVPELAKVPSKFIHAPWTAPDNVLRAAQVTLGECYPRPIVDHAEVRARFLAIASAHVKQGHL